MSVNNDQTRNVAPPPPPPPPPPEQTTISPAAPGTGGTASPSSSAPVPGGLDPRATVSGTIDAVRGTYQGLNAEAGIASLNSDGDSTTVGVTGSFTAEAFVGYTGSYGYSVTVTQRGGPQPGADPSPNDPPVTYEVSFDASTFNGVVADAPIPVAGLGVQGGVQGNDTVTMTFDSKADAQRAVGLLRREALANAVEDSSNLAPGALGPLGGTAADTLSPGDGDRPGSNPVLDAEQSNTNPIRDIITSGPGGLALNYAADRIRPPEEDRAWLQENITSISTEVGLQGRLRLGANAPIAGPLGAAISGNIDRISSVTRTVEFEDGEPSRLTYQVTGETQLESTATATLGATLFDAKAGLNTSVLGDHAQAETSVSVSWDIPPGLDGPTDGTTSGRRGIVEDDLLRDGSLGEPDEIRFSQSIRVQDQAIEDPSRSDFQRVTINATIDDPVATGSTALNQLFSGDLRGAASTVGDAGQVEATLEDVDRSGTLINTGPNIQLDESIKLSASVTLNVGVDDIVSRQTLFQAGYGLPDDPVMAAPEVETPLVVAPRVGLNLRDAPDGGVEGTFRHGTFLQQVGDPVTTDDGQEWLPVEGLTVDGEVGRGFVSSDYVRLHPPGAGAMDENGRTNPTLEAEGYQSIEVEEGDNLWDLARETGVDFNELVALNGDHLIQPDLVFGGDQVFIPGTQGTVAPPASEPSPATPSDDSAPSAGSNPSPSASPTPSPSPAPVSSGPLAPGSSPTESGPSTSPAEDPSVSPSAGSGPAPDDAVDIAKADEVVATDGQPAPTAPGDRPSLETVRAGYQVAADSGDRVEWRPSIGPIEVPRFLDGLIDAGANYFADTDLNDERGLTQHLLPTEAEILSNLGPTQQVDHLRISSDALNRAEAEFPRPDNWQGTASEWSNDRHLDAFRHAYWSARMTQSFGEDWTRAFTTAHEADPANPADREAMDLFNNNLGIEIAKANPDATPAELAGLIRDAISGGEALVIDRSGSLAWSDQVPVGQHGSAPGNTTLPGNIPLPDPDEVRPN